MAESSWTIMLYLSGDNNLSAEMVRAISEIERLGSPADFTITIQYDALSPCVPTCRYVLPQIEAKEPVPPGIPFRYGFAETVKDEDGAEVEDAGDPQTLKDFIKWSTETFPSKYRMLILSGHGSGAVGDFLTDENVRRTRQPGSLTIRGLADALRDAQSVTGKRPIVDVLGMDSCLMSTLEVAYQLRDSVKYMVASEGFVPNTGWPYARLLSTLKTQAQNMPEVYTSDASARLLGECIARDSAAFYSDYLAAGVSFDIALCDVAATAQLQTAIKVLTTAFGDVSSRPLQNSLVLAHWRAQSFKFEQYTDVWDFASELQKLEPDLHEPCKGVMEAVEASVVYQETIGVEFQHAHGLSLYFPWSSPAYYDDDYMKQYGKLDFPDSSDWFEFLKCYLDQTRREVREPRFAAAHQDFPKEQTEALRFRQPLATARNKYALSYGKYAPEINKYLAEHLGGKVPWSMKNPPQQVRLPAEAPAPGIGEITTTVRVGTYQS